MQQNLPPSPRRLHRWLFVALGTLSLGVGVVGIFVPGLPTTVFLLIAGWFYARSHPPLENWLRTHPKLGPLMRLAGDGRSMPRKTKLAALISLWIAVSISILMVGSYDSATAFRFALFSAALVGSFVILFWVRTLPEVVPAETQSGDA